MKNKIRAGLLVAASLLLSTCGGGGGGTGSGSATSTPVCPVSEGVSTTAPGLPPDTLGLLVVTSNTTRPPGYTITCMVSVPADTSITPSVGIDVHSIYALLIPSTSQMVVLDYAESTRFSTPPDNRGFNPLLDPWPSRSVGSLQPFVQDGRAFHRRCTSVFAQGTRPGQSGDLIGTSCPIRELNPTTGRLGSVATGPSSPDGNDAASVDQLAVMASGLFYRSRTDEYLGPSIALAASDPNNIANFNLGDGGSLYAIHHDTANAKLSVHLREQSDGVLSTQLRDLSLPEQPLYEAAWSFKVSTGILYAVRKRIADGQLEVLTTDLSNPNPSTPLVLLISYAASEGFFRPFAHLWSVTSGKLAIAHSVPGSTLFTPLTKIAIFENGAKTTHELGASINSVGLTYRN